MRHLTAVILTYTSNSKTLNKIYPRKRVYFKNYLIAFSVLQKQKRVIIFVFSYSREVYLCTSHMHCLWSYYNTNATWQRGG